MNKPAEPTPPIPPVVQLFIVTGVPAQTVASSPRQSVTGVWALSLPTKASSSSVEKSSFLMMLSRFN